MHWNIRLAAALAASFVPAVTVHAQVASALLVEGEQIDAETISGISTVAANGVGGYAIRFALGGRAVIYGSASGATPPVALIDQTQLGTFSVTGIEGFTAIANTGAVAWGPTLASDTQTGLDSMAVDQTVLQVEGESFDFVPGTFSTFNSSPQVTDNGTTWWAAGYTTTAGGITEFRALVNANGELLVKNGDVVPAFGLPIRVDGGPFLPETSFIGFDVSASGTRYVTDVFLDTGSSLNDAALFSNGDAVAINGGFVREGLPVTATGAVSGELWESFGDEKINDAGTIFFSANTTGNVDTDEVLVLGNQIVLRELDDINTPLGPGTVDGGIEFTALNENGDWAAVWDVDVNGLNDQEMLVLNGEAILVEGMNVDLNGDGIVGDGDMEAVLTNFSGLRNLSMSDRDAGGLVSIFFTADVDIMTDTGSDNIEAAFRISRVIPEPTSLAGLLLAAGGLVRRRR